MRRIAIITPNWLGDAVMSFPLLGLLSGMAEIQLSVWASTYTSRAYAGLSCVSQLLAFPYKPRVKRVMSLIGQGKILDVQAVLVLPPSWSSALAAFLSGVPMRIGYATEGRSLLLTRSISPEGLRERHVSLNYIELGKSLIDSLGMEAPVDFSTPSLKVFAKERSVLDGILKIRGIPRKGFVVIVPGATYGTAKAWPMQKFRQLSRALSSITPVIISGTSMQIELCNGLAEGLNNVYNLAGETSLGVFLALLERADAVVANDSGASHAAASLGTPAVTIFGSTSPEWTRPLGDRVFIVKGRAECSPCFLRECPYELQCFEEIESEQVCDEVKKALEKKVDNLASSM